MLKILYAGSPDAARQTLEILFKNQQKYDFKIVGVLSNPPTAKGRHKELIPTPVAAFAMENQIPVFTPEHLDAASREQILPLNADLLVCFAYGHIFGPKFLAMFTMGGINLHPSALPKYRGCTPVNAAILNGEKSTAISIQKVSLKMDEGNILAQEIVELNGTETAESLLNFAAEKGAELICNLLGECKNNQLPEGNPQQGEASYTGIITKDDAKISWNESATVIEAKIRAFFPEPGCWCVEKNQPLRILSSCVFTENVEVFVQGGENLVTQATPGTVLAFVKSHGILIKTGEGILCVKELQRQGKKSMNYKDFMNGARDFISSVLE